MKNPSILANIIISFLLILYSLFSILIEEINGDETIIISGMINSFLGIIGLL